MNFTTQAPASGGTSTESADYAAPGTSAGTSASTATGTSTITPTTSSWENASYPATVGFAQSIEPQSLHLTVTAVTGNEGSESPAHAVIAGTVEYNPATFTASFRPDEPLPPGTTYHAVATATSVAGKAVDPISWTFTVVGPQSTRAPTGNTPADDAAPPPVVQADDTDWASRRLAPLPDEV